jgi:O-antigen ligase
VVQRTIFFQDGLKLFSKSPVVGRGLGGFENGVYSVQDFYYETKYVHNHYIQVLSDLVFATLIVYVCGGIDSTFHFLYPLVIIVASILLPRSWTYLTASLAFIFYGAVLELGYFGVIPSYSSTRPNPQRRPHRRRLRWFTSACRWMIFRSLTAR